MLIPQYHLKVKQMISEFLVNDLMSLIPRAKDLKAVLKDLLSQMDEQFLLMMKNLQTHHSLIQSFL